VIVRLLYSTRAGQQLIDRSRLQATATGAALLLLLGGAVGVVLLQRRSLRLAGALHEQERLAELGSLAAVLAHEIRNPLAAVKGHAQYALERQPAGGDREALEIIVEESTRLERLVRDLLDYARPRPLAIVPMDFAGLLERVLRLRAPEFLQRSIAVEPPSPPLPPGGAVVQGDQAALEQVLHNLIGNAVEAMPGGGTLRFAWTSVVDGLGLTITDSGPGIDPRVAGALFTPFVTTRTQGTGLGLAVARQVVLGLGGRIGVVASPPGGGASLEVVLRRAGRDG
jgi:two-component system sensor histidine kinase HydH